MHLVALLSLPFLEVIDMKKLIQNKLKHIESEYNVQIVYACESGSRAWEFASPDSDYDVRFIYVRPFSEYIRLDGTRDVIEYEINDVYDINGWDLQKMFRLLYKHNPVIFEWADSPVVYKTSSEWEKIKAVLPEYTSKKSMLYHYLAMMKHNLFAYFKTDYVLLKKYLYVLRPLLACRWVMNNSAPPPVSFLKLCDAVLPKELEEDIARLLEVKRQMVEKSVSPRIKALDDFITDQLEQIETVLSVMPKEVPYSWEKLNQLFAEIVMERRKK